MITLFENFNKEDVTINLNDIHNYFVDTFSKNFNEGEREFYKFIEKILNGQHIHFFSYIDDKIVSALVNRLFSVTSDGIQIAINSDTPNLKPSVNDWMKKGIGEIGHLHGIFGDEELSVCIEWKNSDVTIESPSEDIKKYLKNIFSQLKGKRFDL